MRISFRLGCLVLGAIAIRTIFSSLYVAACRSLATAQQDALAVSAGMAERCLSLIKLVRSHYSWAREGRRYDAQMDRLINLEVRQARLYGFSKIFNGGLSE